MTEEEKENEQDIPEGCESIQLINQREGIQVTIASKKYSVADLLEASKELFNFCLDCRKDK